MQSSSPIEGLELKIAKAEAELREFQSTRAVLVSEIIHNVPMRNVKGLMSRLGHRRYKGVEAVLRS
jgi:hypothetical protein